MVSTYAHNDFLQGIIDTVTGRSSDMDAAEEAFTSASGDFAERFAAAVQAAVVGQARPEVFIEIPQQPDSLSKAELDALVRPAGWLKSYPSKPELLDQLELINRRQLRRPSWVPRVTVDGKPWQPTAADDGADPDAGERELTVEAFAEFGPVLVRVPQVWEDRPELPIAAGGTGQLELVLYSLLGIGERGDWRGVVDLDADANEALVPEEERWWRVPGYDPQPLSAGQDPGVASELLATISALGAMPVQQTDGGTDVMARALAGAAAWRHSPQWVMQTWDPGSGAKLFTAARASLAAWSDDAAGSGLLVHVGGSVLHEHDGLLPSPGLLHGYLLCVTRAGNGGDEIAAVRRLVLSCPGEGWCSRGGCTTGDADDHEILAPLMVQIGESAQLAMAASCHDAGDLYRDLYGVGNDATFAEPVIEICEAVLGQAGWQEIDRSEWEGGMQELLVRKAGQFVLLTFDPATRQVMLSDGIRNLDVLLQILGEDGVITGDEGQETVDTSEETVARWGLDTLSAANDVLRGLLDVERDPAFEPLQATLLGTHPRGWGVANPPGAEEIVAAQLTYMLQRADVQTHAD